MHQQCVKLLEISFRKSEGQTKVRPRRTLKFPIKKALFILSKVLFQTKYQLNSMYMLYYILFA